MSYAIESIAECIGARRVGECEATIDWLLTDSRSLSFPEETLFFALTTKRNSGARYIPDLYDRGVRNFVVTEEDFEKFKNGELGKLSTLNFLIVANPLKALQKLAEIHREEFKIPIIGMGGISSWQDAIEMMMAGATALQIGTVLFTDPYAPIKIADGMNEWLDKNGIKSVSEITGTVKPW